MVLEIYIMGPIQKRKTFKFNQKYAFFHSVLKK
jgi:hypothetical protein